MLSYWFRLGSLGTRARSSVSPSLTNILAEATWGQFVKLQRWQLAYSKWGISYMQSNQNFLSSDNGLLAKKGSGHPLNIFLNYWRQLPSSLEVQVYCIRWAVTRECEIFCLSCTIVLEEDHTMIFLTMRFFGWRRLPLFWSRWTTSKSLNVIDCLFAGSSLSKIEQRAFVQHEPCIPIQHQSLQTLYCPPSVVEET